MRRSAPLRVGYPVADTDGRHHRRFRHRRCAVSARAQRGGRVHRRLHAGSHPGRHGLGGLELADRRREAAADGQREHDGEPLGHVPDRRGSAEHRGQQAGAVRDAVPADRSRGAGRRSALRRSRGSQAPSLRIERRDRTGAGGKIGAGMVGAPQQERRSRRRGARCAGGARTSADRRTRAAQDVRDPCPGSTVRSASCARASVLRAAIRSRRRRRRCSAPIPKISWSNSGFRSATWTSSRGKGPYERRARAPRDQDPGRLVVDVDHRHEARDRSAIAATRSRN